MTDKRPGCFECGADAETMVDGQPACIDCHTRLVGCMVAAPPLTESEES